MLSLPKTTEFKKRIPKQKFYEQGTLSPEARRAFKEDIRAIYWEHKLAPETINIEAGKRVKELEVFRIRLAASELPEDALRVMDKIPYYKLFILECDGKYQTVIGYRESAEGKVERYYYTPWQEDLPLKIEGLSLDALYESLLRQIAGDALTQRGGESLKESKERAEKTAKLEKEIARLTAKMRKEKQLNRQMEINARIKELRKRLEEVNMTTRSI